MNFGSVTRGIIRDVSQIIQVFGPLGWTLIVLTFALPLSSLLVSLRGSRLALIPLLGSVALLAAWVLYHATGRWRLEAGAVIAFFGSLLFGWAILVVALWRLGMLKPSR
ncbi:MAG: hypothetical protein M3O70_29125 [Actinomycetota bacterium]|nr:hypothetical protein [Actinomycetota bacterium]